MSAEAPRSRRGEGRTEEQSAGRRQGQDTTEARFLAAHQALDSAKAEYDQAREALLEERRHTGHGKRAGVTSFVATKRVLTAAGRALLAAYKKELAAEHWTSQQAEVVRPSEVPR